MSEEDSITDAMSALSFDSLRKLHDIYAERHDKQGIAQVKTAFEKKGSLQTPDMENSGVLIPHKVQLDTSGLNMRPAIAYVGDPVCWVKHFMTGGQVGRTDAGMFTGKNSEAGKALMARRKAALEAAGL